MRRALRTGAITDIEASTLALRVARHLLVHYANVAVDDGAARGLDLYLLRRVCDYVETNLHRPLTLLRLAEQLALSPFHFARAFRAASGVPPHAYVTARRIERAKLLLLDTDWTIARIATAVGFTNHGHFRRVFAQHMGVGPGALRRVGL